MKQADDKILKLSTEVESSLSEEDAGNFYLAREITQEIMRFGVNQPTLKKVIELLALELENRQQMLDVISIVKAEITEADIPSIIT
tara:strand:+ start:212 stop:469 length:258 start_codon:yes stop_codon:yes gene_type:complete